MAHLLVTNDFPPKVGGIQSYLWELWRRLPPDETTVLTTAYAGSATFDGEQPFRVERISGRVMLPTRALVRRVNRLSDDVGAKVVVLDPALWPPLGLLGPLLNRPYALVLHGAEVTVPARLPAARLALARAVRGATHVISAGCYAADVASEVAGTAMPETTIVPPGVDTHRFHPLGLEARLAARERLGVPRDALVVVGISRLVPRKGFDALIDATAELTPRFPDLRLVIASTGRDERRLRERARRRGIDVPFLGRMTNDDLPALYASSDVFAMPCRTRWAGLEQEGFGIVYLEAAACGIPQIAGNSGGAAEAVVDGETGLVIDHPRDHRLIANALEAMLVSPDLRSRLGARARERAVEQFSYDVLAAKLANALSSLP